jgi:hypothetical protein
MQARFHPGNHHGGKMNLRRLKYFVKIVDIGSLTQAAEVLHIAQPEPTALLLRKLQDAGQVSSGQPSAQPEFS